MKCAVSSGRENEALEDNLTVSGSTAGSRRYALSAIVLHESCLLDPMVKSMTLCLRTQEGQYGRSTTTVPPSSYSPCRLVPSSETARRCLGVATTCRHQPRRMRRPLLSRSRFARFHGGCGRAHNRRRVLAIRLSTAPDRNGPSETPMTLDCANRDLAATAKPCQDGRERQGRRHLSGSTLRSPGRSSPGFHPQGALRTSPVL